MNPNLTIVREAVIKAVPSIMELTAGCEILNKNINRVFVVDYINMYGECLNGHYKNGNDGIWIWKKYLGDSFEILGRKIGIADVLKTLEYAEIAITGDCGWFMTKNLDGGWSYRNEKWNLLSDSLEDQSSECLQFLAGLLDSK